MRSSSLLAVLSVLVVTAVVDAAPAKDAKIVALANAALKCEFKEGAFDVDCKAYEAWGDNFVLFEDGKGDATIFAMLEDKEPKVRVLASEKACGWLRDRPNFRDDKAKIAHLIAAAKKETNVDLAHSLGDCVADIDFDKLGLANDLEALAKHTLPEFRAALGYSLYSKKQTPLRLAVTKGLIADAAPNVRDGALGGLSSGAKRGKAPEACKLMGEQIPSLGGESLFHVTQSGCNDTFDALAAALVGRAAKPEVAAKQGRWLAVATAAMCEGGANAAQKSKGFAAAKSLTDPTLKNADWRNLGIQAAVKCDPAASKALLTTLSSDADKKVAEWAKTTLEKLDKK